MLIIGAQLESFRTLKDKSLKITFETQELTPQEMFTTMEHTNKFGYLAFKEEPFKAEEKQQLNDIKSEITFQGKTSSQRLRNVLFVKWQQEPEGFQTSVQHYEHYMEKIINHYKAALK